MTVPASTPESTHASTIFFNGEIATLDPERPAAEAVAVRDGKIVAVGTKSEVMVQRGPETQMVDLAGRVLLPSLKDHHVHLLNIGLAVLNRERKSELFLDAGAPSVEEIARRVRQRAATLPMSAWIFGTGWNQIPWGTQKLPTHHALSEAAPHNPVMLIRVDAHCAWVNAAALAAAGITKETPNPHGGHIARLPDGSPSGILLERAVEPVLAVVPEPSDAVVLDAFRAGARTLAAQGITEVYDAGFLPFPGIVGMNVPLERYYELLRKLDAVEPLPLRVNLMIPAPTSLADAVVKDPAKYRPSPRLGVTHIKLFADGAMGSRGAALRHPYADDPSTRGVFRMTAEELRAETIRALKAGLDVATHAIGDAAIGRVLDVYAAVLAANPSISPPRLRIEHFSVASPEDIQRAAKLGVVLCIQPGFVYPGDDGLTMEDSRMGKDHTAGGYAWGTLAGLGAALIGSSDDFTTPAQPLWGFYAAATRKNPAGKPAEGRHPKEKLPRDRALRLFTDFCATGGEIRPGVLKMGAAADFVVLSANPLTVAEPQILGIKVHATLAAGQVKFHDGTIGGLR
jgi:hypothetical protein